MLKLIVTVWRTKLTFYFLEIRKLNFGRKYTGNTPIATQLLSWGKKNLQIRDPRQISDRTIVILNEIHDMAQKKFLWTIVDFCDFRRFSGILDGKVSYTTFFTRITKIVFFFALAQWLLSYEHI
jgi:hypothetical protein